MGLKSHFLPFEKPKNLTLVRSRNRCFKSQGTWNSFSSSWVAQIATWVKSKSDVWRASISLWRNFRTLDQSKMRLSFNGSHGLWRSPKCDFGEINKGEYFVVAWHCELIFCLYTIPKCDLNEDGKTMIRVVECQFKVIFCFLTNRKCDFFQVDKATFQVANGT